MKSHNKTKKISLALLLFAMLVLTPAVGAATITTDQEDYGPDEIVYISGSGFDIYSVITVTIVGPDEWGTDQFDSISSPWWVYWSFEEPDRFNIAYLKVKCEGTFTVTATDGTNTAITMFTDKTTKTVSVTTTAGGSVSVYNVTDATAVGTAPASDTTDFEVPPGKTIRFTANPASGYSFVGWSGDLSGTTTPEEAGVGSGLSVTASFAADTTSPDVTINQAGGQLDPTSTSPINFTVVFTESVSDFATGDVTLSGTALATTAAVTGSGTTYNVAVGGMTSNGTVIASIAAGVAQDAATNPNNASTSTDNEVTYEGVPVEMADVTFDQTGVGGDFAGVVVTIDGTDYGVLDLPVTITKEVDETISFEYYSPLLVNGKQYTWTSTSGLSAAQSDTITVASGGGSVTGNYGTQYYLTVTSPYGLPTSGEGWYDAGDPAYAGLASDVESGVPGVQYVFESWSGDASGSDYSASNAITMDGPKEAIALWTTQYYLTVTSPYGLPTSGEGWYDAGDSAYAGLTSDIESGGPGIQYVFHEWTSDASGTNYLQSNAITMDAPKEAVADWTTQYYLTVLTDPSEVLTLNPAAVSGEGWYDADETATVDAVQNVDKAAGERYDFRSWTGATPTGTGNEADVLMDGPKTVTANYALQYLVTFDQTGLDGTATGSVATYEVDLLGPTTLEFPDFPEGVWVDEGETVTYAYEILVASTTPGYQFWLSSVTGPASPVTVLSPVTITGNYRELPKSAVTTSSLCPFDVDPAIGGQQFRLIFTQDPTNVSTFKLTASNPGQFYYNVFYVGTPGDTASLTIDVPYPFVTQGAMPVHVYASVSLNGECFIPADEIAVFSAQPGNNPDYAVNVTVPNTGLVYVAIHLDYGLKKTVGYSPYGNNAVSSTKRIDDLTEYDFVVGGDMTDAQTVQNQNVFKKIPGFGGIVTDDVTGDPIAGATVQIFGPAGNLLGTVTTDVDGFYFFYYKHKGKDATFTVGCSGQLVPVVMKANRFVEVNFVVP